MIFGGFIKSFLVLMLTVTVSGVVFAQEQLYPIEGRTPAHYLPNDELIVPPVEDQHWMAEFFVEDHAGVMTQMRAQVDAWQRQEEFATRWHLESTGVYQSASQDEKEHYLKKYGLKYLDKRLSGEIKRAEEGSTLARVGKVEKALKPTSKVEISENYRIRVKARVLQGKVYVRFENPYLDESQTEFKLKNDMSSDVTLKMKKNVKSLGVTTGIDYKISEGQWIAAVDKKLTSHMATRLSTTQSTDNGPFTKSSDRRIELYYSLSF